jgi:hypothetical protein
MKVEQKLFCLCTVIDLSGLGAVILGKCAYSADLPLPWWVILTSCLGRKELGNPNATIYPN